MSRAFQLINYTKSFLWKNISDFTDLHNEKINLEVSALILTL